MFLNASKFIDKDLVILSSNKQTQASSTKETRTECKLCSLNGMAINYTKWSKCIYTYMFSSSGWQIWESPCPVSTFGDGINIFVPLINC